MSINVYTITKTERNKETANLSHATLSNVKNLSLKRNNTPQKRRREMNTKIKYKIFFLSVPKITDGPIEINVIPVNIFILALDIPSLYNGKNV